MPALPEPGRGLAYHQLHRGGRNGALRTLVGVFALLVLTLIVAQLLLEGAFAVGYAVAGRDVSAALDRLSDTKHLTPPALAFLNLSLAAAIPVAMLVTWVVHGLRPAWLASVRPRIRWRWFGLCLALAVVALVATLAVSAVLPSQGPSDTKVGGALNHWSATMRDYLLVILFLTPLQAAGEEYAFRGYLTQAFGGLFRQRWAAVVIPAFLFALAHGGQDVPVFFDRFAFGLVAGVLVIATGGLEAGIAMHVLNNFLAFGLALLYGNMSQTLNATSGSWWNIPVTLTQSLVFLALVLWAGRRRGLQTRTGVPDFAPAGRAM
ncbi:CPBP family intramembrane metalloprotease [Nocardioides sp. BP30]|uniref:CPBP family intramembrane glutamic endopeptidase n=1 Tax=Nocardioides sp. BP30 TaxID=3036374 RepID=UPI002468AA6E|nr:CPBP family intramembrane metalloprotease [Nocardioides sp. BP30]WGL53651.1 CPBP family intramembrane metalloprotease [Nocardioides sp. BP30]